MIPTGFPSVPVMRLMLAKFSPREEAPSLLSAMAMASPLLVLDDVVGVVVLLLFLSGYCSLA